MASWAKREGSQRTKLEGGEACGPRYPRTEKGTVARAGEGAGDEEGWPHTLWGRRRRGGSVARDVEALATRNGLVEWVVHFQTNGLIF